MSALPNHLLHRITDQRIRRLIKQVWRKLPVHDRAVLRALLSTIRDAQPTMEREGSIAHASGLDPSAADEGNPARSIEDLTYEVSLHRVHEFESDIIAEYIIAHELAHVVLRHAQMSIVAVPLIGLTYSEGDLEALKLLHEDEANLQAWAWGFQDGLAAFYEVCPDAPRPRWRVELQAINESMDQADAPAEWKRGYKSGFWTEMDYFGNPDGPSDYEREHVTEDELPRYSPLFQAGWRKGYDDAQNEVAYEELDDYGFPVDYSDDQDDQ